MPASVRRLTWAAVVFGLALTAASLVVQDRTYDEPYHIQWSRRLLFKGRTERDSNPLFNSKTPIMVPNVLARELALRAGASPDGELVASRLPGLAWYAATLGVVFLIGRRHVSPTAAGLATTATALDPSLMANAAVATVDAPYTFATLWALAAALRFAEAPGPRRGGLLGLALGVAFVTKFTAVLLGPGLLLLPLAFRGWPAGGARRTLLGLAAVATVAVLVVDVAYLGIGLARPLGAIRWKSAVLEALAAALPGLRLPLPADFLTGLDICLAHERGRAWNVILLGRLYPDGVWHYFLSSWLLKTPVLLILAQLAGLAVALRARALFRPALAFLGLNLLLHLGYFSVLFRAQIGYRYVLMCVPLLALLAAAGWERCAPRRWAPAAAAAVAALSAAESLPYLGNALAFTNLALQPKSAAFRYLTNSSIDWGQNRRKLRAWLPSQPFADAHLEPSHALPGVNVIGLNRLAGAVRFEQHRWLREHATPFAHFRHTYLLFSLDEATFQRLLEEDRRLPALPPGDRSCAPEATTAPVPLAAFGGFPDAAQAWLLCVAHAEAVDLVMRARQGGPAVGNPKALPRDWERLRPGDALWFRLEPGTQALVIGRLHLAELGLEARGGAATVALRPARIRKKKGIELLPAARGAERGTP
jgi:hypothetical protein